MSNNKNIFKTFMSIPSETDKFVPQELRHTGINSLLFVGRVKKVKKWDVREVEGYYSVWVISCGVYEVHDLSLNWNHLKKTVWNTKYSHRSIKIILKFCM